MTCPLTHDEAFEPDGFDADPDPYTPLKYGLTDEDITELKNQRAATIESLVGTESGRVLIRQARPDLSTYGRALNETVTELGNKADSDDPLEARAAALMLNDLMQLSHREATHDLYHNRSTWYLWAQQTHTHFDKIVRSKSKKNDLRWKKMAWRWGRLANAFTLLAAIILFIPNSLGLSSTVTFRFAAALIAARMVVTLFIWSRASYPADDSPDKPVLDSDPRLCVLGHGLDLFLFAAFAYSLDLDAHRSVAFGVVIASQLMILGTMFRIGASASGYPVPRLHLERLIRGLSTFAAVALASVSSVPWWGSAVALVALPTIFAWIEGKEAWRAMGLKVHDPFEPITPSHQFDTSKDKNTVLSEQVV